MGAYYLQPPDARAIFLHNDLLCNDTCSVTGGSITYWGGGGGAQTEKIQQFVSFHCDHILSTSLNLFHRLVVNSSINDHILNIFFVILGFLILGGVVIF